MFLLVITSPLLSHEGAVPVQGVVGGGPGEISLPEVCGGVREAGAASRGVGEDGVLAAVDDGQDLALPRGQLGLGHHLPLLVDSEQVSLLVSRVEDGVVGLVLLLATHRGDGVVGDLGAEGDVAVL